MVPRGVSALLFHNASLGRALQVAAARTAKEEMARIMEESEAKAKVLNAAMQTGKELEAAMQQVMAERQAGRHTHILTGGRS